MPAWARNRCGSGIGRPATSAATVWIWDLGRGGDAKGEGRSFTTNVIPAQAGTQYTDQRGDRAKVGLPKEPCDYILASRRNGTLTSA
jgi:hypothetical protein